MTIKELREKSFPYGIAVAIDGFFPHDLRFLLRYFFMIAAVLSFAASVVNFGGFSSNFLPDGLFFLFLSVFIILSLLEVFYNSSKFSSAPVDFSVAEILLKANERDILENFLDSRSGTNLLSRLGISNEEKKSFLKSEKERIIEPSLKIESDFINFAELAKVIYESDPLFESFISARSINKEDFIGAAYWITHEFERSMKKEHWWDKDSLELIPSIGTTLSYGRAYELSKYGRAITDDASLDEIDLETGFREKEVSQVLNALLRGNEANAILVDNDENIAKDIVTRIYKKIRQGIIPPILEHKIILELDWNTLLADKKSKGEFEEEYIKMLQECASTGNIILYISNLPSFISGAQKIGVNLPAIMEEYLVSPKINIIAHSIKTDFYYFIEMNPGLGRVFERIVPEEQGAKSAMPAVLEKVKSIEKSYRGKLFFTYPAIREVTELSDRFVAYGEMPTKAIDMLSELSPWALREGINVVFKNDVDAFVSTKTGIAIGEISENESAKLTRLEELLHERIVGQEKAVEAVSSAMRRSRAGIGNPSRPIASFLFLGPTGVGKTETAKALAESFFGPPAGGEEKMTRFDMSEYNGIDALPHLIGSFSEGKIGNLSSKLRDAPYGVVLLDEFEKAAPDVLNLFLRILDEGKFTDAFGGEVNVRNSIIIATSNAGSEMIWNIVKDGEKIEEKRDAIIDHLIDTHVFKPELLNRFDDIVIYKPLKDTELRSVADKMLVKLINRIREEKQIEVRPSSELADYLVLHGADKEFGARSINRVMQDKIEDSLAKKIISGAVHSGSIVEIGVRDIL